MFRRKSAAHIRNLLEYLASAEQAQHLKSNRVIAQTAVVDGKNADLAAKRRELANLLHDALAQDSFLDLDSLKKTPRIPAFDRKRPARRSYLPKPPSGFGSLLPWRKTAYDRQYEAAEAKYRRDSQDYDADLDRHQQRVAQEQVEIEEHNQEIERAKQEFAARAPGAIVDYFTLVLEKSAYPAGFPQGREVAYAPDTATLRIEFALPAMDVIPTVKAYAYDKIRDAITQQSMPQKQRRLLYSTALAAIGLRAVHEVFTADRGTLIDSIAFDGYADGINPSSGQPGRFCLVALHITRQQFDGLDLRQVEPRACLKGLNARLSDKPDQLLAVPPMTEADLQEATAPDASAIAQAERQIGELKTELAARRETDSELASELRDKQAVIADLESKLEAQRDRIAELAPELRSERARNAELSAENQKQRERIAELERDSNDDAGDTEPVAAISEMTADSEFAEAGLFTPIGDETAGDGVGARIPPRKPEADPPISLRDLLQRTDSARAISRDEAVVPPADLPYSRELVGIIGELEDDELKLLKLMMTKAWECSEASVQSAFPGVFISAIIHDINECSLEAFEDLLIEEEGGLLFVHEEYRDALERALK